MSGKIDLQLLDCKAAGYAAARAGLSCEVNPHLYDIRRRSAWLVGWQNGGGNIRTGKVFACLGCRDSKTASHVIACPLCCPAEPVTLPPDVLAVLRAGVKLGTIGLERLADIPGEARGEIGLGLLALDFALAGLSPDIRALLETSPDDR